MVPAKWQSCAYGIQQSKGLRKPSATCSTVDEALSWALAGCKHVLTGRHRQPVLCTHFAQTSITHKYSFKKECPKCCPCMQQMKPVHWRCNAAWMEELESLFSSGKGIIHCSWVVKFSSLNNMVQSTTAPLHRCYYRLQHCGLQQQPAAGGDGRGAGLSTWLASTPSVSRTMPAYLLAASGTPLEQVLLPCDCHQVGDGRQLDSWPVLQL